MKAAVLFESNKPMPIVELDQSEPKTGEVRVNISAAGVCASAVSYTHLTLPTNREV